MQRTGREGKKIISPARIRPIIKVDRQLLELKEVDHKKTAMESVEAGRKWGGGNGKGEGPSGVIQRV